jgi:parvulin-like peptidyl-prolyl isomerase
MQGSKSAAIGLLVVAAVAIAVVATRASKQPKAAAPVASASASASVAPSALPAPSASASAGLDPAAEMALSPEEGGPEGFDMLPDGRKAPPLPDSAPQQVSFGVVQFAYTGAQFAPANARTKEQAKQRALSAIEEAKRDFSAAVAKGDPGSAADKGRVPRGILEPAAEYVLFTLPKGEVSAEPVDTPRGYWILRRIN